MDDVRSPAFPVHEKKFNVEIEAKVYKNIDFKTETLLCLNVIVLYSPDLNQGLARTGFLGNKTDIVISSYDDHFFVLATQIGSMGTILHARKEEAFLADPTFEVSIVFGKYDEPMITLCGRKLIEHISKSGSSKPLILSLGLKDHSMATVKGIISAVTKNCLW